MSQAATFGRRAVARTPTPPARPSSQTPRAPTPALTPVADSEPKGASVAAFFMWLLFGFSGRLSRTSYRYCRVAANLLFLFTIYPLYSAIARNGANLGLELVLSLLAIGLSILMMWTTLAMQIKRRHDRDKGWPWLFLGFIPIVGPLWVLIETCWLEGTPGYNRFDDASEVAASTFG
jgi:uncharacterized membrane protein YhaH (DUF805 family)